MAKINKINFIVSYELFPFDVMFSFGETDDEITKALMKHIPKEQHSDIKDVMYSANGTGRCAMLSCGATVVRLKGIPKSAINFANLQHEIFHAVEFLFWKIGVKHDPETNGEVYAYTIQYLTERVYEKLSKCY